MAVPGWQPVTCDEMVEAVAAHVGTEAARQFECAQHSGRKRPAQTTEFMFEETVVEARVVSDEDAAGDPRSNFSRDVGERRRVGDHRVGDAGERLDRGRNAAARIDKAAPLGYAVPVDTDDADFSYAINCRGHAGGFDVDEGDGVGKHGARLVVWQGSLTIRTIVRYCSRYVERSFLP